MHLGRSERITSPPCDGHLVDRHAESERLRRKYLFSRSFWDSTIRSKDTDKFYQSYRLPSCPKIQTHSKTRATGRRRVHLSSLWRAPPPRAWQRVCVFGDDGLVRLRRQRVRECGHILAELGPQRSQVDPRRGRQKESDSDRCQHGQSAPPQRCAEYNTCRHSREKHHHGLAHLSRSLAVYTHGQSHAKLPVWSKYSNAVGLRAGAVLRRPRS